MTKYLDPQLAFALLEFIRARAIYKDNDVLEAQIKLLKATNMVEFTMELYNELHGANSAPKQMEERRDAVIQRVTELQENSRRIFDVISDKNTVQNLKADRNLNITFLKVCLDCRSCVRVHFCVLLACDLLVRTRLAPQGLPR